MSANLDVMVSAAVGEPARLSMGDSEPSLHSGDLGLHARIRLDGVVSPATTEHVYTVRLLDAVPTGVLAVAGVIRSLEPSSQTIFRDTAFPSHSVRLG